MVGAGDHRHRHNPCVGLTILTAAISFLLCFLADSQAWIEVDGILGNLKMVGVAVTTKKNVLGINGYLQY